MTNRREAEAEIASGLSLIFADTRAAFDRGDRIKWDEFAAAAEAELQDQLLAVYIVIFMMMSRPDLQNSTLLANSLGRQWASTHAKGLSRELTNNTRGQLNAGADSARVFAGGRAAVMGATEVTRAITQAETDARRANADQESDGRQGGQQTGTSTANRDRRRSVFDVGDGLTAIWITERDARVCPICSPLNNQRAEAWADKFPSGPPAHPNCRCHLEYVTQ